MTEKLLSTMASKILGIKKERESFGNRSCVLLYLKNKQKQFLEHFPACRLGFFIPNFQRLRKIRRHFSVPSGSYIITVPDYSIFIMNSPGYSHNSNTYNTYHF